MLQGQSAEATGSEPERDIYEDLTQLAREQEGKNHHGFWLNGVREPGKPVKQLPGRLRLESQGENIMVVASTLVHDTGNKYQPDYTTVVPPNAEQTMLPQAIAHMRGLIARIRW